MGGKRQDELTLGQKLVGLNFNPSGDDKVTRFKQAVANAIDILYEDGGYYPHPYASKFAEASLKALLEGQMFGVKAQTWED